MLRAPLVSIITINYNSISVTCELLKSLRSINYKNIEIIVVDNASRENPLREIEFLYPEVKVIVSSKNLGFAGGNNLGYNYSSGEYLFFVNNDTELEPNCIRPLIQRLENNNSIGIVSPKIKYFDQKDLIQYAGFSAINPYTARNHGIGTLEVDTGQYDTATYTHYAHGAAMMVKRSVIEKVGLMPEDFFLYYEELDWCEQMKRAGYKIFYEPKSIVYHKESFSIGQNSPLKTYYLTRNRILFMKRNFSKLNVIIFSLFFIGISFPKNFLSFLKNKEFDNIKALIKGSRYIFI